MSTPDIRHIRTTLTGVWGRRVRLLDAGCRDLEDEIRISKMILSRGPRRAWVMVCWSYLLAAADLRHGGNPNRFAPIEPLLRRRVLQILHRHHTRSEVIIAIETLEWLTRRRDVPLILQVRQDYASHEDIVAHCDGCLRIIMGDAAGREDPELVAFALSEIRRSSVSAQSWRWALEGHGSQGARDALRQLDGAAVQGA